MYYYLRSRMIRTARRAADFELATPRAKQTLGGAKATNYRPAAFALSRRHIRRWPIRLTFYTT